MFDLSGRTALVTGATGGIGNAIAKALHAQGATVTISGTRREVLDSLATELGSRVHVQTCNLSNAVEVEALVPAAELAGNGVQHLAPGAGYGHRRALRMQRLRDRAADAAGRSGNERRPASQIEHANLLSATYSVFKRSRYRFAPRKHFETN